MKAIVKKYDLSELNGVGLLELYEKYGPLFSESEARSSEGGASGASLSTAPATNVAKRAGDADNASAVHGSPRRCRPFPQTGNIFKKKEGEK